MAWVIPSSAVHVIM
jgi:hypothetical protein